MMVILDQQTRRIIGFSVKADPIDGVALCCMFNQIISGKTFPNYLSTDNDPLFLFQRWQANLRILDIDEIKSVPNVLVSHPFVERSINIDGKNIVVDYFKHLLRPEIRIRQPQAFKR